MSRTEIRRILNRISVLGHEINRFVPLDTKSIEFRADLAGLLVVATAAAYESCVKETLIGFASQHHVTFGEYTERRYSRLSSRIRIGDLYEYCRMFDSGVHDRFGQIVKVRKKRFVELSGRDFFKAYNQILDWRHDFAHGGIRNTTVEEALQTHRAARVMLHSFDDAFQLAETACQSVSRVVEADRSFV